MSDDFVVTPSFPEKLEQEGACLTTKQMPFASKAISWVVLFVCILISFQIAGAFGQKTLGGAHIIAVVLGAFSYLLFTVVFSSLAGRHNWALQRAAREKSRPFTFHFAPDGFKIDARNSKSDYDWDAVEDVAALTGGTGVRIGVFVYPVADEDLPEGMTSEEFRARLDAWRTP